MKNLLITFHRECAFYVHSSVYLRTFYVHSSVHLCAFYLHSSVHLCAFYVHSSVHLCAFISAFAYILRVFISAFMRMQSFCYQFSGSPSANQTLESIGLLFNIKINLHSPLLLPASLTVHLRIFFCKWGNQNHNSMRTSLLPQNELKHDSTSKKKNQLKLLFFQRKWNWCFFFYSFACHL